MSSLAQLAAEQGKPVVQAGARAAAPAVPGNARRAIGSVDTKQLETLMARGLDPKSAVDLIIRGMLT
jgi:hypothetical protein